jgi:hypothetical protein
MNQETLQRTPEGYIYPSQPGVLRYANGSPIVRLTTKIAHGVLLVLVFVVLVGTVAAVVERVKRSRYGLR